MGIRECLKPKTIAITYDDGPYIYTEKVMAQFEARNAHATFFVTGNNIGKGSIDENWTGVISKMYANGHQVASHTWSHQNLDEITHEQRVDQMVKNEMAIRNILGKYPTYMRPPYSACITEACMADMATLGYVITSFDLDTDDYNQQTPEKIQIAKDNFKDSLDAAGPNDERLAIAHDIHELTALNLTGYMLDYVYSKGWTAVTVGECMNDPEANWYRDSTPGVKPSATPSSSAPVPTPTGPTSEDGQCGSASGQSCIGFTGPAGLSECCSPSGWCGNSDAYCGTGCNPLYGKCGPQPSVYPSATVTSAAPLPTVSLETSTGGDCGYTAGKTCKGFMLDGVKAECCSEYNFCGNTEAYCGTGCNPIYGNCGTSGSSSSSSESASASVSASASLSASVSSSASVLSSASVASISSTVSASASPSVSLTSSAVVSSSSAVSSSASQHDTSSVHITLSSANSASASASASISASASASASVSASVSASTSASVSASASASASASVNDHASSSVHVTQSSSVSASASASKHDSSSMPESKSSSVSVSVSASATPSASASKQDSASSIYPTTISTGDAHSTHTPTPASSTPVSKDNVSPSGSPSTVYPYQSSTMVYPSTMSTLVRPTSTPCDDDKVPTPTPSAPVSKDGKCGKDNGGQTCKL
jgi:hypothetical protein